MFWRYGVPLIIVGLLACALLGWALAWWYDRRAHQREDADANQED